MSRLDSFIRRLEAQRSLLDWAVAAVRNTPGPVLEIGLGNGRTYDHLRCSLPGRDIYAFDRTLNANPKSVPPEPMLVLGEFASTLPAFARSHGGCAALVHSDVGLGDPEANRRQVALMGGLLAPLLAPGALLLSDQDVADPALRPQPLPDGIQPGRYFVYTRH